MKKRFINIRLAALRTLVGSFALLALLSFVLPQAAQASTAANTVIRNTVTVNFNDTAGHAMAAVQSTVDITVNYVYASATLSAPGDLTTTPGSSVSYSYTITSNANGDDNYNLTDSIVESTGNKLITGSTVTFNQGAGDITSVTLGATTVAANAALGATAISVPNDSASNSSINGIVANDIIVINGVQYTVLNVVDNGGAVGTMSTINLTSGLTGAITAGMGIFERQTFNMKVTPGTVDSADTVDPTITVTTTVKGSGPDSGTTIHVSDDTVTTVHIAKLTIDKTVSPDGITYYNTASAPKFITGNTVWYKVVATNNGSSNATAVTLTDPVPAYTTYVANSTTLNGKTVLGDGVPSPLIGAGLLIDDDSPVRGAGLVASGILHPAGVATVIFKVTVN